MSAASELEKLFTALQDNFSSLDIADDDKQIVQWFIEHTFNSYLPAVHSLRKYLEGETKAPDLLKVYYAAWLAK